MAGEDTACGNCGNDMSVEGGVVVYYRFGLPGRLDGDGFALPHSEAEMGKAGTGASQDSIACGKCDCIVWAE